MCWLTSLSLSSVYFTIYNIQQKNEYGTLLLCYFENKGSQSKNQYAKKVYKPLKKFVYKKFICESFGRV